MSNKRTRVAVVGVGEIGTRAHIPAYLHNKDVDLVALVDADERKVEKTAKKFGIKRYFSSIDELFQNQDVDAISICTPPNTHAEIALKALANDVHVLCEKPLATNTDDGKKLFEASRKKDKILMVGFNLRFQPNYEQTIRLIKSGRVGHVYLVECDNLSANPLITWSKSTWFFRPETGGGVLSDKGPHVFDLINYAFNDFPNAVSALSSTYFDSSVEDSCVCILEYPGNRIGIGKMSWLSSRYIEDLSVHGTSESVFASPSMLLEVNATDITEVALWRKTSKILVNMKFPNLPLFHRNRVNLFQSEIDHFVNQIRSGEKYSQSALNGLNVLITCEAARKSLENGEKISVLPIKQLK
jgi:predicted dehydrogenase